MLFRSPKFEGAVPPGGQRCSGIESVIALPVPGSVGFVRAASWSVRILVS